MAAQLREVDFRAANSFIAAPCAGALLDGCSITLDKRALALQHLIYKLVLNRRALFWHQ